MITIGKTFSFEAAHQLPFHEGKCKNLHGHRYELTVEITGPINLRGSSEGMIMDYADMTERINRTINDLDHKNLNDLRKNPTTEILLDMIVTDIMWSFEKDTVVSVTLKEGEKTFAKWYNPHFFPTKKIDRKGRP